MSSPFVSVVVPAYNEAACIERSLGKIVEYLSANFSQFEVIAVDDGSTDATREKIAEVASGDSRVIPISYPINRGKGYAVRQGVLKARGDAVIFTDADLSTPMEEVGKAVAELTSGNPVVVASRQHPNSAIVVHQGWIRERIGRGFNLLVRKLLPLKSEDTQCGFKCFTRQAAGEIFSVARIDGFAFDVEVLLIAQRLSYPIKEIPVYWTNSPESKVRPMRNSLSIIRELLQIYWNDRHGRYGPDPGPGVRLA